ncbi:EVE domain-containing protein [Desulfurobacterium thermolithotrophum]|uniref:EVE domain-containing protein n=1 Tax=Desulfurobacterium thermolithotrophum TaxID=64160 RepID=UPI0013D79E92|nr:EVE domain-containing protein [Desulfurobacterium thermolithotrophum]
MKKKGKKRKTQPTGYWIFFCNPKIWKIDEFLKSGKEYDTYTITEWQKNYFKPGDLGVIRVGTGCKRLKPGIYAIVEVLTYPEKMVSMSIDYWQKKEDAKKHRYRVEIKYLKSLLENPLFLEQIKSDKLLCKEEKLIKGFQGSSFPLSKEAFDRIVSLTSSLYDIEEKMECIQNLSANTLTEIRELEEKYKDATPRIKEVVSKRIERGKIAQKIKELNNYECQICKALNKNPKVFKKPDGTYYIETHHLIPVSSLEKGSLRTSNLITVCPNHHRQLHYGNVKVIENTEKHIIFEIDNQIVKIEKVKLS